MGAGGGTYSVFRNVDAYKLIPDWFGLCIVGLEKQRKDDRTKERTKERNKEIIYVYITQSLQCITRQNMRSIEYSICIVIDNCVSSCHTVVCSL